MFDSIKASKRIKEEFISYILTQYSFADSKLRIQMRNKLQEEISKGPYLQINDIFSSGKSVRELVEEGVLSPLFFDLEKNKNLNGNIHKVLPLERPLYFHQENAIRKIVEGNNVVISTGTGSGKTNCFLIPVINSLLREKEAGTLGPGIRALFIYPMNALANDQLKNIRKLLMDYEDITFGVYNGGTEYEDKKAIEVYESMFSEETIEKLKHPLPNELLSRNKMKETPPNILFTNYAMLEHLLFRPNDDVLFSKSNFKFVVLDEAHIYSGSTGIETSILLRRLKARIATPNETQFILTSATLGSEQNDTIDNDIVKFAENLCGVNFKKENIIRAQRKPYIFKSKVNKYPMSLFSELSEEKNYIPDVLDKYNIAYNSCPVEEMLYDLLDSSFLYNKFRSSIKSISSVQDIKNLLELDDNGCISFLSLCSRAIKNGKPLLDVRFHFFIRCLEGCYLSLVSKELFLNREKAKDGSKIFEIAVCDDCGKIALVGKVKDGYLNQANRFLDESNFYCFENDIKENVSDCEDEEDGKAIEDKYYLCPYCGKLIEESLINFCPCDCNKKDYIKVIKCSKKSSDSVKCNICHRGRFHRFYLGNDAATSVLATSLYEELPETTIKVTKNQKASNNLFIKNSSTNKIIEEKRVKQFLVFSDSRQEAAKFACYMGKSYDEFLRRRGICHIAKKDSQIINCRDFSVSEFANELQNYFDNKKTFASSINDKTNLFFESKRNAWVAMLNELARINSSTSLTSLGILQFDYLGNDQKAVKTVSDEYGCNIETAKSLLDLLAFEIVRAGAICSDDDTDIGDNDREYIFFSAKQKFITKMKEADEKDSNIISWSLKSKPSGKTKFYASNKLYYVMKALNIDEEKANKFLDDYFEYLIDPSNNYGLITKNNDGKYVMPAKNFRVKIAESESTKWFKCNKCGRVSQFSLNGHCITINCNGIVHSVDPLELSKGNHFAELYFSDKMNRLFIKEHTAQLSKEESADYQEKFIRKDINALSCSTTFEMGVDVGDLETVFLRDVPPLPSNYAQRAGRAGRSINSVAYCLTYAKLSSHDLYFFKEPKKMINGTILPPLFKIDNEKIVRRHIYDVALSLFFSLRPDLYNENDANAFINEKGYLDFYKWLRSKPDVLLDLLKRSIPNVNDLHNRLGIDDFSWVDSKEESFIGKDGVFTMLINEYENNVENFKRQIASLKRNNNDLNAATKCENMMKNYMNNKLIDFLVRGNVLPRYGFPVDTVELEQITTASNIKKLRLSRDLAVAIAEYAPSSEIIADGNMYTSRYIKKSAKGNNKKEWSTAYIGKCPKEECQAVNFSLTPIPKEGINCSACNETLFEEDFHESIEPISGFATERRAKDVPMTRQVKNYRTQDIYIGNTESRTIEKQIYKFKNTEVIVESTINDSLLVESYTRFYVCPKCGFAYASDEIIADDKEANENMHNGSKCIKVKKRHEGFYSEHKCDCVELDKYSLHYKFNTDVAKINFDVDTSDYKTMVSTMYAILYAISDYMYIDRKDIKACLYWKVINNQKKYSIIIFDAVSGGAGQSRRLVTQDGKILNDVFTKALNNMKSCSCDSSCYNCLRSYENQKIHEDLNRNLAIKFLEQLV